MFYLGNGQALGLLTLLGYGVFVAGAAHLWRNRENFSVWVHDEVSALRRNLSRHTAIGPFYGLREESRFKALPAGFVRSLSRMPRSRIHLGAILLFIGSLLLVLDFFI
jgi:hypothetical protein